MLNQPIAINLPQTEAGPSQAATAQRFGPRVRPLAAANALKIVVDQAPERFTIPVKVGPSVSVIAPQPFARPSHPKQQPSRVLHRRIVQKPVPPAQEELFFEPAPAKYSGFLSLFGRKRDNFSVDHY